jgi:hypothetical protein
MSECSLIHPIDAERAALAATRPSRADEGRSQVSSSSSCRPSTPLYKRVDLRYFGQK